MFHLHKQSQLITLDPQITLTEYEHLLNKEGLTGGYYPITGFGSLLIDCLRQRTPNFYYLKYGSLEDLCAGITVVLKNGEIFSSVSAPRAATGSDLRKVMIGSENLLGDFKEVTLRVFPMPEWVEWGIALFEIPHDAGIILRQMITHFFNPLFASYKDQEESNDLLESLNIPLEEKLGLIFKLAGIPSMIKAQKETLAKLCPQIKFYWISTKPQVEMLDKSLINKEEYQKILARFSSLLGIGPKNIQNKAEMDFRNFFDQTLC